MKTLTHTDGGDSLSDFLANDPLNCEKLLDYIYIFYLESQTSIYQNMRLDQYSSGKITVIQRHSYQFMVRESMRIVNFSSSPLLPSYFADRRWMRNLWSSGGRQWSTSGVLVANSWFNAWFSWSLPATHGSNFVIFFRCVRLAPRLLLMSCEARIASVAISWLEFDIKLWKKPKKRSHKVTSNAFTCGANTCFTR